MGTLRKILDAKYVKKIFIMDRNDGKCYVLTEKTPYLEACDVTSKLEHRYIERLEFDGRWAFVILDRLTTTNRKELLCDSGIRSSIKPPKKSSIMKKWITGRQSI